MKPCVFLRAVGSQNVLRDPVFDAVEVRFVGPWRVIVNGYFEGCVVTYNHPETRFVNCVFFDGNEPQFDPSFPVTVGHGGAPVDRQRLTVADRLRRLLQILGVRRPYCGSDDLSIT